MYGVAVVTRKGPFMVGNDIFVKKRFAITDKAGPDFELLALKFDQSAPDPRFRPSMEKNRERYSEGLTILRSPQCPYSGKNVTVIMETAQKKFGLVPTLVELDDAAAVQDAPCPFGTFCILYNGKVISHHPISSTRFENIMNKIVR
jgi:hypothetical protein